MVNAPWYIRNNGLHRDLQVDVVSSKIQRVAQKHKGRLHQHENADAIQLLDNTGIVCRLQMKKPFEVV
jgi:ribosome-associated translation inhibitor RaiA